MNKKTLFILVVMFCISGLSYAQKQVLWYDSPGVHWEEAIPLGNSRLGAMVYGTPHHEEIQLNEETIWGGKPHRNDNSNAAYVLPIAQQLIFEGKKDQANKLINANFFSGTYGMPYQTAGSVFLDFAGHENYRNYYRELNLDRAVATTRYTVDGVEYTREAFVSFADDVVIMRISANRKGCLHFNMSYTRPADFKVFSKDDKLILESKGTEHEKIKGEVEYQVQTQIKNVDGDVNVLDDKIQVSNATTAIIYISIASNFIDYKTLGADFATKAAEKLETATQKNYKTAIKEHEGLFSKQFGRFKLNLGSKPECAEKNTIQRIVDFQKDQDPALVALLCQFGRYLLICSSQPGGQPANLQGIWCQSMRPSWDSKYTLNINAEMNYWPAEVTNLSETHLPFLQMIKELSESGQKTASSMYNAKGWTVHHNTDVWRETGPIDYAGSGMWPTGSAWVCQHIWEHYLFTGDKKFLAEFYPVLKGACDFFLSTLVKHPQYGWMVVCPSVSPEHGGVSAGCTMDNQLVFDLLTRTAKANEILDEDLAYRNCLRDMVKRLAPMQVGQYTQLQEWLEDKDKVDDTHRHVSHLYGLYPSNQISPYRTPELFEAARNSLLYRGDFATGWSIGWKVNLWARLLDGNHAYEIVNKMLTLAGRNGVKDGRTYANLFTAHPPFQIDGNFGLTAGVAEMLVQSHDGAVHLLPAVPDIWKTGSVSGIKARGGFEVSMNWEDGDITEVTVASTLGGNLRLRSYVPLKGKNLKEIDASSSNMYLETVEVASPIISPQASLKGNSLKKVYEYDVPTKVGGKYTFKRL
ncbi:MAG: glycoside hydrolase family 95 protein [Bacteroides sp.]|nr:glycoside hydrolase family 95 protein [Bacteroides sp.]